MSAPRLPPAILRPLFGGVDTLYIAFQGALKSLGMVADSGPAPEVDGGGVALLPRHEGKWPELWIPLPPGSVYWYSVESVFRRAALWRVGLPPEEARAAVRAATEAAWPSVAAKTKKEVLELSFEAGGLVNLVKVVASPDGTSFLSVGQRIRGLRFEEAERALDRG